MLRDVEHLLHTAAYHEAEIDRILDPEKPSFIAFDPELGYVLKDYTFGDGEGGMLCEYVYEPHGGHRKMVNYADRPCRINTYGNSFTQCAQVNNGETWQEILAAHFGEPIRNYGVGGYGVYQAYRRALRNEQTDLGAEYVVLNVWDDDHKRNLDAARWIRVAWMCRDLPRGGADTYPVHGFPWNHVRFDLRKGGFVELPGLCRQPEDLRKLVGKDAFYDAFKDDSLAHLYTLTEGGEAPVDELEKVAEAFGLKLNLRDPATRTSDARRLHSRYALRSTMFILDKFRPWLEARGKKLLVLLSYDVPTVMEYLNKGERFDTEFVSYLERGNFTFVDTLRAAAEEYRSFNLDVEKFVERFYIARAGAQVFGHYNPYGNFWFAFAIRNAMKDWLDPRPPHFRT